MEITKDIRYVGVTSCAVLLLVRRLADAGVALRYPLRVVAVHPKIYQINVHSLFTFQILI